MSVVSILGVNMRVLNPFKKYDVDDFPGAFVPLDQAVRHSSVIAEAQRRSSATSNTDQSSNVEKCSLATRASNTTTTTSTMELLREEVEADLAALRKDSAYDRKAVVINKAIQDINMGRYQYELFVLTG